MNLVGLDAVATTIRLGCKPYIDGKYVFSVFPPDPKYTVYLVYLEERGEKTPPWCIMCICFKVKYTVYLTEALLLIKERRSAGGATVG